MRFVKFACISGIGWLIDVVCSGVLVQNGLTPFTASTIGAGAAVAFVYVASRLLMFGQKIVGTAGDTVLYIGWQIIAISIASLMVSTFAHLSEEAIVQFLSGQSTASGRPLPEALALATSIGKMLVTPLTLTTNFLFVRWLTEGRHRFKVVDSLGERK